MTEKRAIELIAFYNKVLASGKGRVDDAAFGLWEIYNMFPNLKKD